MFLLTLALSLHMVYAAPPQSKLARFGEFEVKQLVVPGFEQLPHERKLFAYYLSEAMEAGRDIAWEQLSPNGLALRHLFEAMWPELRRSESPFRPALERYYFLLLHNHGPHDQNSNEKVLLEGISQAEFVDYAASLGANPDEVKRLLPDLFDPEVGRYRVAREGFDKIADSGTAFYGPGVTEAALRALPAEQQRDFLSTPVVRGDGLALDRHRADGRFGELLKSVAYFLERAREYGTPEEVALINAHLKTIATGDPADQEAAERLWVQYKPKDISFVIGFTETYDDPLEARGTWEGFLLLKNVDEDARARNVRIRALASEFERRMPVDEEFKKTGDFVVPESEGAYMLRFAGGHNERSFRGVNLPNDSEIREELGSQSFTAYNKVFDIGDTSGEFEPGALDEFYLPQYHNALLRFGRGLPLTLQVEFHEILGHGSGRDRTAVNSSVALGSDYSAMEEARAEIAALYTFTDPEFLLKEGILPASYTADDARSLSETAILEFFTEHLESYVDLDGRTEIRQAHQLGRQMILNRVLQDGALEISRNADTGVPRVQLGSLAEMRESFGGFWRDIQRLKSTGDAAGLRAFIAQMGAMTVAQKKWAVALTEANKRLALPKYTLYLNPVLDPVYAGDNSISEIVIRYARPDADYTQVFDRELQRRSEDNFRNCETELTAYFSATSSER